MVEKILAAAATAVLKVCMYGATLPREKAGNDQHVVSELGKGRGNTPPIMTAKSTVKTELS